MSTTAESVWRASAVAAGVLLLAGGAAAGEPGSEPATTLPPNAVRGAQLQSVPGEVIVKFRPGVQKGAQVSVLSRIDASVERELTVPGAAVLQLNRGESVAAAVAALVRDPSVLYAQPNYLRRPAAVPNDPRFADLWGLHQASDADIDAPEAWDISTGDPAVTVAIVDTGVDYGHPDLAPNMWTNPGETGVNGVDDDGNGLIDDFRGWDYVDNDNNPRDPNGHGTHVAGTIGARGNDSIGVAGVQWSARLMPLRVCGASGCPDSAIASAFAYAGAKGVHVVNASLGGPSVAPAISDAITNAPNTLFVVAAGNSGVDTDVTPSYPCALPQANIVCVAATDQTDSLAGFSNRGATTVDLAAPGVGVVSSVPEWITVSSDDLETAGTWITGGVNDTWARTTEIVPSPSPVNTLTDSPGAPYLDNTNSFAQLATPWNLAAREGCRLDYSIRNDLGPPPPPGPSPPDSFDRLEMETSVDGVSWASVPLGAWVGSTDGDFIRFVEPLDNDGDPVVYFRWRLVTNASVTADGAYVDNVRVECLSNTPGVNAYATFSGTSMAAPHVAGTAALLWAVHSGLTVAQVKTILLESTDPLPALASTTVSGGRLNAFNAVRSFCNGTPATQVGTDGANVLLGTAGADVLVGLDGADSIQGADGEDWVCGGAGDDRLYGQGGSDRVIGGAGDDRLEGGDGDDRLDAMEGDDRVEGGNGDDANVSGGLGADRLLGGDGADNLSGGDGNDVLQGGAGADTLDGGNGTDVGDYTVGLGATVDVALTSASADGFGAADGLVLAIESLWGGPGADTFRGDPNPNMFSGGGGNDDLDARGGSDTVEGGVGNDTLEGNSGNDVIRGGTGDDVMRGSFGNDLLYGEAGADSGIGDFGNDRLDGGDGDDALLEGGPGADTLTGGPGDDSLAGGADDDRIEGGPGNDPSLAGGAGKDWVLGESGSDSLFGDDGDDVLLGGQGADTLNGGLGTDTGSYTDAPGFAFVNLLLGTATVDGWGGVDPVLTQIENLWGTRFGDTLVGDDGANVIRGGEGNDDIFGNGGDDLLEGWLGIDHLDGGAGSDLCLSAETRVSCP